MKTNFISYNRSFSFFVIAITFLLVLAGCNDETILPESQTISFPEFFIEKGSDIDSSYISFKAVKKNSDTLEIQGTSWGAIEYGLILEQENIYNSIFYKFTGICGTVSTFTWQKVTLSRFITASEDDNLQILSFTNFKDTLTITKETAH